VSGTIEGNACSGLGVTYERSNNTIMEEKTRLGYKARLTIENIGPKKERVRAQIEKRKKTAY